MHPEKHFRDVILQPSGSEERGVLEVGSISDEILPSCQDMKLLHYNYPIMGLVQYKSLR